MPVGKAENSATASVSLRDRLLNFPLISHILQIHRTVHFSRRSMKFSRGDCYMMDRYRRVDYVLAHKMIEHNNQGLTALYRNEFEKNLKELGLQLEYMKGTFAPNIQFILIHAPFHLLTKQAEYLKIMVPILAPDLKVHWSYGMDKGAIPKTIHKEEGVQGKQQYFMVPFVARNFHIYIGHENPEEFFTIADRIRMVYDVLNRTKYDSTETKKYQIGIERLIDNGSYSAAYPLHEACKTNGEEPSCCTEREFLYRDWVKIANLYKCQPLMLIKEYFGQKIGMYFAWFGFYTKFLIPLSIASVLCATYGFFTAYSDIPSNEICGSKDTNATIILCPNFHYYRFHYATLDSTCTSSKLNYIFNNNLSLFCAFVISIGTPLFLKNWKRYNAKLSLKWKLRDFEVDEESIRPEYQFKAHCYQKTRFNPKNQQWELFVPMKKRILGFVGSSIAVIFFLALVIAFVVGAYLYRIILLNMSGRTEGVRFLAMVIIFATTGFINLLVILFLGYVYRGLAMKLTQWECPRTQEDFDTSYTFKVFLFQFINYYSSIFYIAFFKSSRSALPNSRTILGLQTDSCDSTGCMLELSIQLAIIMCGKQFVNAVFELAWPMIMNMIRSWNFFLPEHKRKISSYNLRNEKNRTFFVTRWEADYFLNPLYRQFLFYEYLKAVIQFGFVTLFVSAFPLAPLFALLNNMLEIRTDAYKYTLTMKRSVPERAKDIGVWLKILKGIGQASVLTNAIIIAFTGDFIPKFVYVYFHDNNDLRGYVNYSLSYFDTRELDGKFLVSNVTICRFYDFREPPCVVSNYVNCGSDYGHTIQWWIVLAFRIGFVLAYEHTAYVIEILIDLAIPDIPSKISKKLCPLRLLVQEA